MVKIVNGKVGSLVLSAIALIIPSNVSAEEIALTFQEHNLTLTGEYTGFVQNAYVIQTENGEVHVPVAMVTCEGRYCAEITPTEDTNG